jgi:release factor glutamine methyltransferase
MNNSSGSPDSMPEAPDGETVSWRALLRETEAVLAACPDVENPDLEARWMVEELVDAERLHWSDALDEPARVRGVARLDEMVARRRSGEPIQYVLGHWQFRALDLMVDRRVLIPRPETEIVAGVVLAELDRVRPGGAGTVVDLGTGSGAIGLSVVAERPGTRVVLTDRSEDALAVARANLAGLGIIGSSVEIAAGSWFDALPTRLLGECDVVVSNPPYVAADVELPEAVEAWEPAAALRAGPTGLDDITELVRGASRWLRGNGVLVLEIGEGQAGAVRGLAEAEGYRPEVRNDLHGLERVVIARRS